MIEATQLGKGYVRFMQFAEDLISCEPKINQRVVAPIMLEVESCVFEHTYIHRSTNSSMYVEVIEHAQVHTERMVLYS